MNQARWTLLWLCSVLWCGWVAGAVSDVEPVINSIAVAGTNLDFVATFPSGVERAVLEMRKTLMDGWQTAALLNVSTDGGTMEFTIPKPALDTAFFRLNVSTSAATNSAFSTELQFVAVPPLGPDSTNTNEAVFHFKGMVDGSDRIVIQRQGAMWEHVHWGWPDGAVIVNDAHWNPSEKNFLTATGAVLFLPEKYDLLSPKLEVIATRDVVAMERTNEALIVYLDDTQPGAALNEFKIYFPLVANKPKQVISSQAATLKIAAFIDGSDVLKITQHEATWMHHAWGFPGSVKLNDVSWEVQQTNVLVNTGTNQFLLPHVDFSTAKIANRKGRDVATMRVEDDAIWINFADNPNGGDNYELEISFGP